MAKGLGHGATARAWAQCFERACPTHPPAVPCRCGLVLVDVEIPLVALADGVHSRAFSGCGVVVHQSEGLGLVLVDRNTAAVGPGDVLLSFGAFPGAHLARRQAGRGWRCCAGWPA